MEWILNVQGSVSWATVAVVTTKAKSSLGSVVGASDVLFGVVALS